MYQRLLGDSGFYRLLQRLDEDLAAETRVMGCWCCGKALHAAHYTRKPRGVPPGLEEGYCERYSFCCADRECRKRRTAPSLRFLSRRVYTSAVVVLVSALRCGTTPRRLEYLEELVGASRRTILRWRQWWTEMFPETPFWRVAAGTLMPPLQRSELPASLLERFTGDPHDRLLALLRYLTPISTATRLHAG
jgi:hypothetical protein